jgi:hypothetical protein
MTRTWLGRLAPLFSSARTRRPAAFRPAFVRLEDRAVPATFYVDPTFAGATAGDTVTFNAGEANQKAGLTFGTDAYATILDALTAANGAAGADTIVLSSDTHNVDPSAGPLEVTDGLTLTGSGKGVTTVQPTADTPAATGETSATFRVSGGKVLDVSDLTFDGKGGVGGPLLGSAFRYFQSSGTINRVTIRNVIDDSVPGETFGYGVVAFRESNVKVADSLFENNGYIGVTFYDNSTGEVRNSSFVGRAASAATYGVEVADGSTNVLITGSTFSGFNGTSAEFSSAAVSITDSLTYDSPSDADTDPANEPALAFLVGNSITGNEVGVSVGLPPDGTTADQSTAFIQYNTITGNEIGTITDTTSTVNALFNFWGPGGPLATNNATSSGDNPDGQGNEVGPLTLYQNEGETPNDGVLVQAPTVAAVPPIDPTLTPAEIIAQAGAAFVAATNFDNIRPTVAVTAPAPLPGPFGTAPLSVTLTFSEVVAGVERADLTVGGTAPTASIVAFAANADGKSFAVTLTADGPGTVTLAVADRAGQDANGNFTTALAATVVGQGDFTAPTVTLSSPAGTLPINYSDPFTLVFTFSEPVTQFDKTDITLAGTATGGTVQTFTANGDGTVYTAVVGGFTTKGTVTAALTAGAGIDAAGNPTPAAGPVTVAVADLTAPVGTIMGSGGTALPAAYSDPLAFQVTFSEPVTGFDKNDISLAGSTAKGGAVQDVVPNADNTVFAVTLGGFSGKGDVVVSLAANAAADAAGNTSAAVGPVTVATADTVAPTVTVTGPGPLPLAFVDPVAVTFTFSEPVTGFDRSDIQLTGTQTGGEIQNFTASADNKVFTVTVGGFDTPGGSLSVSVAANAAADLAGNPTPAVPATAILNAPTTPPDKTGPIATITSPTVSLPVPFTASPLTLTVNFNEAVTGFEKSDIQVTGTATGGSVQTLTSTDNKTFTVTLGGFTGAGTVIVAVPPSTVTDAAGNANPTLTRVTAGQFNPSTVPPPPAAPGRGFAIGIDQPGRQEVRRVNDQFVATTGVNPFTEAGYTGGVRVASADVNGDGTLDVVVGSGVGRVNEVIVYNGTDLKSELFRVTPFEASFTGGVFVAAADLNGDGKAEVIITPDVSGGPRVDIYSGAGFGKLASFFGIDDPAFRGGARAGTGDVNGDGTVDLLVSAGFGGGPRIAIYDGKGVVNSTLTRITPDFFGFEDTLRNGAFLDGGDVNGDGFAEVFLGAGPGGGPRVRVLDGKMLMTNGTQTQVANFFAGNSANRGGVRVSVSDIDGDGRADLVTGPGEAGGSAVTVYLGTTLTTATPAISKTLNVFGDFNNGVFVG